MAQSYVSTDGTLIVPGAYPKVNVQTANSGLASSGIVMLVGEAEAGPRFSAETSLADSVVFGPSQLAAVVAKYGSGPLVDGFRAASVASADAQIPGSPTQIVLIKTNASTKASAAVLNWAGAAYETLYDRSYGKKGNLIAYQVTANVAEAVPTTGAFSYIGAVGTVNIDFRINGAAVSNLALAANRTPAQFVAAVAGVSGLAATGGVDRVLLTVSGTIGVTANPGGAGTNVIDVTRSVAWNVTPTAGDTLIIPEGSPIAGGSNVNVGNYVITTVSSTVIRATKLSDAGKTTPAPVIGTITAPGTVAPAAITAATNAQAFSPVTISLAAGNPVDGAGKTLEVAQLLTGTDRLDRAAFTLGTATIASWISTTGTPAVLTSATEYRAKLTASRQLDNISEDLIAGGEVALTLGYTGTTATVTVTSTTLTTSVTGGSGGNLTLTLADFPSLADLAVYINAQTGYTCAVGSAVIGQLPSTALDRVSALGIATSYGTKNGRVKVDAYKFGNLLSGSSVLLQLGLTAGTRAAAGVPRTTSTVAFLSGGTKGASTTADFTAGIDALENMNGNFLVPCISRNAAADSADGLTESGSTYDVDSVNAYAKTHVLKMSTLKRKKNRQAVVSKKDTFTNAKAAASNIASFRVGMTFQDFKQNGSTGSIVQFQPWMGACLAAGMQTAAFYRAIFNKSINTSGVLMADGSFNDQSIDQMEEALQAGLMPAKKRTNGGYTWVSDQTTYGTDSNFVFNSLQAVYVADIIALSTALRMENAFLGQSTADVSAAVGLSFLEGIMADFLRLKLIAPSDDAPAGFRNAQVQISGTAMIVSVEVKLAGAIYFIPITFLVSQVQQSASL